jgi:hypothetical protein
VCDVDGCPAQDGGVDVLHGLLHDNCLVSVGEFDWLQDKEKLYLHTGHEVCTLSLSSLYYNSDTLVVLIVKQQCCMLCSNYRLIGGLFFETILVLLVAYCPGTFVLKYVPIRLVHTVLYVDYCCHGNASLLLW